MAEFQWLLFGNNGSVSTPSACRRGFNRPRRCIQPSFGLWNHDLVNYDSINGEQWDNARNFAYFGLVLG